MFLCLFVWDVFVIFRVIVYTEINYGHHLIVFPCFSYKFSGVVFEKDTELENMYSFKNVKSAMKTETLTEWIIQLQTCSE